VVIVYWLIGVTVSGDASDFRKIFRLYDDFRQEAWQAATTLLTTSQEPFLDGAAQPDRFSSFRWFVGYGLDTLEQTQSRFGIVGSGDKYLDRFHNHIYDAAGMQGWLGLTAWVVIYGGITYLILDKLQLVNRQTRWVWLGVEFIHYLCGIEALRS
jgi:hypothetical protein